ncbi:MAG: threonylcarbamoyl-AMP synthase [Crocinitomicaceae bacterium]|nr:threonylcarbamoyl-AMP synthase [Crocinitomicaceae bacterium]MBK8926007.1 threonylcarbamoyl-AMP synthase [Crocinitomicaceae bacterium]
MKAEIDQAAKIISQGGVILYPTDTIWGLGCDPQNTAAIEKICQIKKRSESQHFIVLVNSDYLLNKYTDTIPEICYDLMDMTESPLTIIYPKGKNVSSKILAEDGSIGIRMVNQSFCTALMNKTRTGLVSTSANISGKPFPASYHDIDPEILKAVDYTVNVMHDQAPSKPSRIIKINMNGEFKIIRK